MAFSLAASSCCMRDACSRNQKGNDSLPAEKPRNAFVFQMNLQSLYTQPGVHCLKIELALDIGVCTNALGSPKAHTCARHPPFEQHASMNRPAPD
jgi:hypothetical protein